MRYLAKRYLTKYINNEKDSIIAKAARFAACEMIEGDYLEFGVYQGKSFINSYKWLKQQFNSRINLEIGGEHHPKAKEERTNIWKNMRFIAFDSFEGLPPLSNEDSASADFQQGQYACSEEAFSRRIQEEGVPLEKVKIVPGFFDQTCNDATTNRLNLKKAAIVWLDADLYSSTKTVLQFITPLLQDGTILIFDDWYSFRGNPQQGVQKAFYEWCKPLSEQFIFHEYQKDSWKRMSFIVSEKIT